MLGLLFLLGSDCQKQRNILAEWIGTLVVPDDFPVWHSHESGNPVVFSWIPASAGMTHGPLIRPG